MKDIKRPQFSLLETNNMSVKKKALDGIKKSTLDTAKEKSGKFKDKTIETIQNKTPRGKRDLPQNEQRMNEL